MSGADKLREELATIGLMPGRLLALKIKKTFWKGDEIHKLEDVFDSEDKTIKTWAKGESFHVVLPSEILMFLGVFEKEVEVTTFYERECNDLSISHRRYNIICFLHGQQVVWWDPSSIGKGLSYLTNIFEVITDD